MDKKILKTQGVSLFGDAFLLKVSADGMEAVLSPKTDIALLPEVSQVKEEIGKVGIVHGVKDAPVPLAENRYLVAQGVPPVHGENARIRFFVKPLVEKSSQSQGTEDDTDAKVDFRELGGIVNVKAEQLLLEKIPPGEGQPGVDVCNDAAPPKPGRDVKIKLGSGVKLNEEEDKIYAVVHGKFVMLDEKASVLEEHTVSEDVDMSVGNVTFAGSKLDIYGAVLTGFKVRCRGSITIAKGVNDAEVLAGGAVVISGGVIGEHAVIRSMGDASIDFLENGPRVNVGGHVQIGDASIQSFIKTGGSLKAISGKGLVVGGECIVGGSMYVRELGSSAEVVTEVTVGVNPVIEQKKRKLAQDQEIWPARMSETLKNVNTLNKMKKESGKNFPPDKKELLNKYNAFLPKVMEKVNQLSELQEEINAEIDKATNESIYVYGKLFPGVKVTIGNAVRVVASEEECVAIRLNKSNLQIVIHGMSEDERALFEH